MGNTNTPLSTDASTAVVESGGTFKLLTQNMNIHHFVPHSYNARESRVDGLLKILHQFDLIALQEVFTFNSVLGSTGTASREKIVKGWGHNVAGSDSPPWLQQDSGLLILSKFKIEESKSIAFSDRNPKEYFSQKGALRVKIRLNAEQCLYIITTHMDAHQQDCREQQLDQLVNELITPILGTKDPIVVLGDFNIDASGKRDKKEFQTLVQKLQPLKEVREIASLPASSTYTDGFICLDHVFIHNVTFDHKSYTVNQDWKDVDGNLISDHYGISLDVIVPSKES